MLQHRVDDATKEILGNELWTFPTKLPPGKLILDLGGTLHFDDVPFPIRRWSEDIDPRIDVVCHNACFKEGLPSPQRLRGQRDVPLETRFR